MVFAKQSKMLLYSSPLPFWSNPWLKSRVATTSNGVIHTTVKKPLTMLAVTAVRKTDPRNIWNKGRQGEYLYSHSIILSYLELLTKLLGLRKGAQLH